jgi:hypothetical protein
MIRLVASLVVAALLSVPSVAGGKTDPPASRAIVLLDAPTASPAPASLNVGRWLQVNQDPKSYGTGVIDVEAVMVDIAERTQLQPPEWVMLDFEDPFFADLARPVDAPERQRAVRSMLDALRAAKRRYPATKWGFYGLPNVPFWVSGKGWGELAPDERAAALARFESAARDVLAEADWVSVSCYDYYDPKLVDPTKTTSIRGTPDQSISNGIAWRTAQVEAARRLAGTRPVVVNVCPFWAPGGIAPECRLIPVADFVSRQVAPCLEAGADGIAIWGNYPYRVERATSAEGDAPGVEAGFGREAWRAAITADFLGGAAPPDWSDPALRLRLNSLAGSALLERVAAVRAWESSRRTRPRNGPGGMN